MKYRCRTHAFALYDYTGMERHLSAMARKGFLLDKITPFFWRYRRCTPQALTFNVVYGPAVSDYALTPTEEQLTLEEFCAADGWHKAADFHSLQFFYTAEKDPVPLETDQAEKWEHIHRIYKKNLLAHGLLLLCLLLQSSTLIMQLRENFHRVLTENLTIFSLILLPVAILYLFADTGR